MSSAIVTGVSSGIGLEIAKTLQKKAYSVYGISRKSPNLDAIHHLPFDLSNVKKYEDELNKISKELKDLKVLVHSAGVGVFGLHEELNIDRLRNMIEVNLTAPIILTRTFLRTLKENKGWVIFISSITASKSSPLASAYSATKSGLSQFANSLWEEARKSGLRVVCIEPDITNTDFYKGNWFEKDDDLDAYIEPTEIADILENILHQRPSVNILNLKIQPRLHKIKKIKRKNNENN